MLFPKRLGNINRSPAATDSISYSPTLNSIEMRNEFRCGVIGGRQHPGLLQWKNDTLSYVGMDVDYCRGIAASLFAGNRDNSRDKLRLVVYESTQDGFVRLSNKDVDVLVGAEYNIHNDILEPTTGVGCEFSDAYYYFNELNDDDDDVVPLSITTRQDPNDAQGTDFVNLLTMLPLYAEDVGITQTTAIELPILGESFISKSPSSNINYKQALRDFSLKVGNYAEIYEKEYGSICRKKQRYKKYHQFWEQSCLFY